MNSSHIIGIDLGGTNISAGLVIRNELQKISSRKINAYGSAEEVLEELFSVTDELMNDSVTSIGIGVPGLVDIEKGLVFDVVNIPSWKEIALRKWMEERYRLPVSINNDANCFALGEFYFGKGKDCHSMIGLTIGTGLGSGLILNKKLYSGKNCGAGEFGMISYLDKYYEYYASGQYFKNVYQIDGEVVFQNALKGNLKAIKMYEEMGTHLGNAIRMILYALDVELIILGGSVRLAYPYFSKTMWQQINTIAFQKSASGLRIEISELENSGVLGAAALFYEQN
ncbi:MAG TPA: ROK family protein [Hanamia sp.]|nr:ROK family protein [Hanamia sp.]